MSGFTLLAFRIFVILLGVWTGSGVFDSVSGHFGWAADPVGWVRGAMERPGAVNPWPFTTMLLLLATLIALVAVWRSRAGGRREALIALGGVAVILVVTFAYFVPVLGILAAPDKLTDAQIVSHSHTWIALNAVRQVVLLALFYLALVALGRPRGS